jgi:hypothetical protein
MCCKLQRVYLQPQVRIMNVKSLSYC